MPIDLRGGGGSGGSGTVTSVSVVSANGLAGTVATATTTPAITLSTTVTGVLKGNGTAISTATSGTDYSLGTSALATGILKSTTGTGALSIAVAADIPTVLTTRGDLLTRDATTNVRLAKGATGKFLTTDANDVIWSTATLPGTATGTGTILIANGTNWVATTATYPTTTTANQILHSTAANVIGGNANLTYDGTTFTTPIAVHSTSTTTSLLIGGTATTSFLALRPTSGVGTTGADIIFQGGNNGATEFGRFKHGGGLVIGGTTILSGAAIQATGGPIISRVGLGGTFFGWVDNANGAYRALMNLSSSADVQFFRVTGSAGSESFFETIRILNSNGNFGIGVTPTAALHLKAGTATASTAPLKFTSGTNLTTAEAGTMEYNGTNLFFTRVGTTREGVLTQSAVTTEVVVADTSITVNIGGVVYKLLARA